jgi:hypothetical protein
MTREFAPPMVAINTLWIFKNIRWLDDTARIDDFYAPGRG